MGTEEEPEGDDVEGQDGEGRDLEPAADSPSSPGGVDASLSLDSGVQWFNLCFLFILPLFFIFLYLCYLENLLYKELLFRLSIAHVFLFAYFSFKYCTSFTFLRRVMRRFGCILPISIWIPGKLFRNYPFTVRVS